MGQIRRFLEPYDLEIWRMTLKDNRAPLLSNIKLCATFHHHMWIQTGVTVWKRINGVMISVTLTFDLWPWPFAWTSRRSMVITPENFRMIRWWEHSEKRCDGRTDGQTERSVLRAAWSQLKNIGVDIVNQWRNRCWVKNNLYFGVSPFSVASMLKMACGRGLLVPSFHC